MNTIQGDGWKRRGFSLLWEPRALAEVIAPARVVSMREFFAHDEDEFVAKAAWLASDPEFRGRFRAEARPRLEASVLMDASAYGTRLHAALRECWRVRCADHARGRIVR